MKHLKYFSIAINVILLLAFAWLIYDKKNQPKTAFVIIEELYNNFEMKKEMEAQFVHSKNQKQKILDSLAFELQLASRLVKQAPKNNLYSERYFVLKENYIKFSNVITEENEVNVNKIDKQIITQLNQYVNDFGLLHNYTFIYGNTNDGSLMYASEKKNITKEVIEFVNLKYKGL